MRKALLRGFVLATSFVLLASGFAYADPGDEDDDHPHDVNVQNWQTFRPRVTALRSLNAYLATDKNQQVYYVPTLEDLPGVENAVSDCHDYSGARQQFAAVYKGYFDQMCYEALVRKNDGTYSKVPAIVSSEGANSVRELTTLGYDFLLTSESISNIQINGEDINAEYHVGKVDATHGYIDLNTALMDIYKAVGQEKYDIVYAFSEDNNMTVENSPIQGEINVTLSKSNTLDTSAGKGWVFATRTNPSLYWKQAAYDGVVFDTEALGYSAPSRDSERPDGSKSQEVSLAEFCAYAYNIMNIYGEPVMTQSEKNILLQLYGSVVPYQSCLGPEVEAIEAFIAKGIISPDDDQTYLNWNGRIRYDYMLTLLMRIKDVNARKTYKDVQITMDASMINNDYYNAQLSYNESSVMGFEEAISAARVTNYYDYYITAENFRNMAKSLGVKQGLDVDFFIPTHLVFEGKDGTLFPLTTQVTPVSRKVYSNSYPNVSYVLDSTRYDAVTDGVPMQFIISNGISDNKLHLRVAVFDVNDLIHDDGKYHLYLADDSGKCSTSAFTISPGGGIYYESGVRSDDKEDDMVTDDDEDIEYNNDEEIQKVIDVYEKSPKEAERLAQQLIEQHPEWTVAEIEAIRFAASDGEFLSGGDSYTYYMTIVANSENSIEVINKEGTRVKLSDIMASPEKNGLHYVNPDDITDLGFHRINSTTYQVENCADKKDLTQRVVGVPQSQLSTAYCKQDKELMVSSKWLLDRGFIAVQPSMNADETLLMLSTSYSNIYLDKAKHVIVVGSTVYSVPSLDESEIWKKMGDGDIYINFRAVLGWTGDFMVFKNTGNSISVSIKRTNTVGARNNSINGSGASSYSIPIYLSDIGNNILGLPDTTGNTVWVQGYTSTKANNKKTIVPMVAMYPFCNYFVVMNEHYVDNDVDGTYRDWLFVFKPADVTVNGRKLDYDDTSSRQLLRDIVSVDIDKLDKGLTVWAYPLYRSGKQNAGMPKEMTYSDDYGYVYTPQSATSLPTAMASYMNTDNVKLNKGEPEFTLPFYLDSNNKIRCLNYNTFKYKDATGYQALDYGQMPAHFLFEFSWKQMPFQDYVSKLTHAIYSPIADAGQPGFTTSATVNYSDCEVFPAVTSPALWFLDLNRFSYEDVVASMAKGSQLYWGTMKVSLDNDKLYAGSMDITDKLKGKEFMLMRETSTSTSVVGKWYSVSALTAFDMEPLDDSGSGTTSILEAPGVGTYGTAVDVIDWEEFKLTRILETCEFGIAMLMILTLNILPRLALGAFLILTSLGVIQNVKLVQLFCDRLFDPYKFLTAGRRNVHTFRSGRAFISSIIAMAVFALFMDGFILHLYEWLAEILAILTGLR